MRRFGLLVAAGLVTLVAEVLVFAAVARWVGVVWALLAILATSVLGGWLVRREGVRSWRRFRAALDQRRPPGREVSDGLVGLVGALLLAVPGFVTDVIGVLLLAPPLRWVARDRLERTAQRRISPALAGDLFGPRRVRARRVRTRGPAAPTGTAGEPATGWSPPPAAGGDAPGRAPIAAIEGEVVRVNPADGRTGPTAQPPQPPGPSG